MTDGLLHQLRVVVTRPREQVASLVEALEKHGAEAVPVPSIRIEAPPDGGLALRAGLRSLRADDWVVITSPNGAARVGALVAESPLTAGVKIAVVGPGTKARVEAEGLTVDLMPDEAIAEGLAARFPARPSAGGRVVLARAEIARETLPLQLALMGWNVDDVVAYRTVRVDVDDEGKAACGSADAVAFTSGSTVESLIAAVGVVGLPPTVFAIGPATAAVAEKLGVTVDAVAPEHTIPGLVDAIREHYTNRPYVHVEDPASADAQWCLRQYHAARDDGAEDVVDLDPSLTTDVSPSNELFLVARIDGIAVGCGCLERTAPGTGDINRMWLSPEGHGQGLGRAMLDRLVSEARRFGIGQVRLETNQELTEAIDLYRSAGFVEVAAFDNEPQARTWFALELD